MDIMPAPIFLPLSPTSPHLLPNAHSLSLRTPFDFSIMGPRAHNDDASSNSSTSVRSSHHGDNEQPESWISQYGGKPYYILDEEGLPYDPWFDLQSSKTLLLLKLLADEEHLDALSKTPLVELRSLICSSRTSLHSCTVVFLSEPF
jgi:hypothetical protein